jgi:hypothetical protein
MFQLFLIGVIIWFMHVWIAVSSCILDDVFDLFRVNLFELVLGFVFFAFILVVFFIFISDAIRIIIIRIILIRSCNLIGMVVDESVLVLELKAFETLLVCHVFDSFDDDIGHWYLMNYVP